MVSAGVAIALGTFGAWLVGPLPDAPDARELPDAESGLGLNPGESAAFVSTVTNRWIALVLHVLGCGLLGSGAGLGSPILIILAVAILATLPFAAWTVSVNDHGLQMCSVAKHPAVRVPIREIEYAEATAVDAFGKYGGIGLRTRGNGSSALIARKGPALLVKLSADRNITATVDHPELAARLINDLVRHHRGSAASGRGESASS
ncbi:hypothetical protein [Rhodococcus sp. YH3-3]|uniref:hypothetical protein n=1 Tax=Rhodococcus sp. YH3-3 TaxID=1803579 RepID=UPI0007DAF9EE|nr:hypothetical protein [Rhodococcus sp. YH3-3]